MLPTLCLPLWVIPRPSLPCSVAPVSGSFTLWQSEAQGGRRRWVLYSDFHPASSWIVISCLLVLLMAVVPGQPSPRAQFSGYCSPQGTAPLLLVSLNLALYEFFIKPFSVTACECAICFLARPWMVKVRSYSWHLVHP